jgi:hypothetical protein
MFGLHAGKRHFTAPSIIIKQENDFQKLETIGPNYVRSR